jgi:hypothetical protein
MKLRAFSYEAGPGSAWDPYRAPWVVIVDGNQIIRWSVKGGNRKQVERQAEKDMIKFLRGAGIPSKLLEDRQLLGDDGIEISDQMHKALKMAAKRMPSNFIQRRPTRLGPVRVRAHRRQR